MNTFVFAFEQMFFPMFALSGPLLFVIFLVRYCRTDDARLRKRTGNLLLGAGVAVVLMFVLYVDLSFTHEREKLSLPFFMYMPMFWGAIGLGMRGPDVPPTISEYVSCIGMPTTVYLTLGYLLGAMLPTKSP